MMDFGQECILDHALLLRQLPVPRDVLPQWCFLHGSRLMRNSI
jgi:hypothetical protein